MSYIEKARELGEALLKTAEVQGVIAAEKAISSDPETKEAFMQYQEKERQLVATQMLSKVVPEKESLALIDLKVRLMNKYPLIRNFFAQQQKFEKVMAMVNLTITTTIHGMPSADQLPLPEEVQKLAQQVLDSVTGGKAAKTMDVPADLKLPQGFKFPNTKPQDKK
ncbi:MAG: YlbF family regulator [Desulfitobacterium hafniense]|nr:YlbF family regulator [Desulfitobacterium hafniense]